MLKIYLSNPNKDTEEKTFGKWVNLPVDEEDLEEVFTELGMDFDEIDVDNLFITKYDCEEPSLVNVLQEFGEYESLDYLNEMEEMLDNLDGDELEIFNLCYNEVYRNLMTALELINNMQYIIYHNCTNMEDVAKEVVEMNGLLDEIPNKVKNYFDYKSYGRMLEMSGSYYHFDVDKYVEFLK